MRHHSNHQDENLHLVGLVVVPTFTVWISVLERLLVRLERPAAPVPLEQRHAQRGEAGDDEGDERVQLEAVQQIHPNLQ